MPDCGSAAVAVTAKPPTAPPRIHTLAPETLVADSSVNVRRGAAGAVRSPGGDGCGVGVGGRWHSTSLRLSLVTRLRATLRARAPSACRSLRLALASFFLIGLHDLAATAAVGVASRIGAACAAPAISISAVASIAAVTVSLAFICAIPPWSSMCLPIWAAS